MILGHSTWKNEPQNQPKCLFHSVKPKSSSMGSSFSADSAIAHSLLAVVSLDSGNLVNPFMHVTNQAF
jgi:hypothetical protein